ncbi:MAG: hypothetical protein BM556_15185 [Bacteriovorax sp. MedPE-SWde]|nr:MAG: hypothetical protein BM556_15185 [Bacteriovorax sp. MedPE-SWde]
MKFLIALVLITTSITASAARKSRVTTEAPTAQFYFNKQIKFIPLTQVCINGDELQTTEAHNLCVEYKPRRNNDRRTGTSLNCKVSQKLVMNTSIEYKRRKCVKYNRSGGDKRCSRYEDVTYSYPTTFTKTVRKQWWVGNRKTGNWGWPGRVLNKSTYTIPACY